MLLGWLCSIIIVRRLEFNEKFLFLHLINKLTLLNKIENV